MTLLSITRRLWLWGPPLAYLLLIFHLSGRPQLPWTPPYPDYLMHAAEYSVLAILLARAVNQGLSRRLAAKRGLLAWTLCVLYAVSDEVHQAFVPGRSADPRDVLADAAGAALGLAGLLAVQRALQRGAVPVAGTAGARVVLYSRSGCAPCFAVKRAAGRAARRRGVELAIVDVDSDPDLRRLHGNEVPVLALPGGRLIRGGATADEIDRAFREAALAARPAPAAPSARAPGGGAASAVGRIGRFPGERA
jgi:VanZ family protein/glutaredoxin